jgi:hypothetical protein
MSSLVAVDNDAQRLEYIRMGGVGGIDSGTRGTDYFDLFYSER